MSGEMRRSASRVPRYVHVRGAKKTPRHSSTSSNSSSSSRHTSCSSTATVRSVPTFIDFKDPRDLARLMGHYHRDDCSSSTGATNGGPSNGTSNNVVSQMTVNGFAGTAPGTSRPNSGTVTVSGGITLNFFSLGGNTVRVVQR